jgi:DNA-binding CsgD family transcriptional regulator
MVSTAARHLIPPPNAANHGLMVDTVEDWIDQLQTAAHEFTTVPPALQAWLDQARAEVAEASGQPVPKQWADLVSTWDSLGCVYSAAEARHRQADALLRAGGGRSSTERAEATRLLSEAARAAAALGAEPLRREVEDLARRARLRLDAGPIDQSPVSPEPSPFGLTDRELQVLRLVNEGHSNGEIGAALFISVKTASVHVSNILRKLGAANRIEAAAIARRHLLVDPVPRRL